MEDDYSTALPALRIGDVQQLERLRQQISNFPHGADDFIGRAWITNAIDLGSPATIRWMLDQHVNLDFRDDEGRTPLHSALGRAENDRYLIMDMLLTAGAPVNRKGVNDYTPSHFAAVRDDVPALRLFVRHGADLSIRTNIDDYATPLEEARLSSKENAASYLASVSG